LVVPIVAPFIPFPAAIFSVEEVGLGKNRLREFWRRILGSGQIRVLIAIIIVSNIYLWRSILRVPSNPFHHHWYVHTTDQCSMRRQRAMGSMQIKYTLIFDSWN
jgi:hypothetical protein